MKSIGDNQAKAAQPSRADELQKQGPTWLPKWLAPLGELAIPLVAVLVVLLLLIRIFTQVRWLTKLRFGRLRTWVRWVLCLFGIALGLGGAYFLVAKYAEVNETFTEGSDIWAFFRPFFGSLALAAFAAVVGAGMVAAVLASRMRVSIVARDHEGKSSEANTGRVVAYLTELAGAPPRGLQLPSASDVTALSDGVLVEPSSNKAIAMLQKVIQTVLAIVPWTVVVDESSDGSLSVVMKLNGWGVTAVDVNRPALHLQEDSEDAATEAAPEVDLLKMVAAIVVANLAQYHRGFEGLCGASDWRSIGLQYVATTNFQNEPEKAKALLGYALDWDPQNLLAELALQHTRFRTSSDSGELLTFMNWIKIGTGKCKLDEWRSKPGYRDLYRRLLLNHVVTALNLRDNKALPPEEKEPARKSARRLMQELGGDRKESGNLREIMRPVAAIAYRDLHHVTAAYPDWFRIADASLAPWASYNMACHFALEDPELNAAQIKERLAVAFMRPELMDWAKKDPSFRSLHKVEWFQEVTGAIPRGIWEIEPFRSQKNTLEAIGVKNPEQLIPVGAWRLQKYLKVDSLQVERLIRLARLAKQVQIAAPASKGVALDAYYVEFTAALIDLGIENKEDIVNNAPDPAKIAKTIQGQCLVKIPRADIQAWLTSLMG